MSWLAAGASLDKSAKDKAAAEEQAKRDAVGKLKSRPAAISRETGVLEATLKEYLDGEVRGHGKEKGKSVPAQYVLATMETLVREVLGRPANSGEGQPEIKPKMVKTFMLNKAEVQKYVGHKDKVQLHADKGPRMTELLRILKGDTLIRQLKKLPAQGTGGLIGKLTRWHAEMSTWMREESAPNLTGVDIISDRLSFAARALPQIAILRDKYEGLITQLNDTLTKARSVAGAAANSEPPPKRVAATGSAVRVRATRGWSASKQAQQAKEAGDTRSYVSVTTDEVVTVVRYTTGEGGAFVDADGDVNLDAAWFEVELEDGTRGLVPAQMSSGFRRFKKVEQPQARPAPPPPQPLSSGEDSEDAEGAAWRDQSYDQSDVGGAGAESSGGDEGQPALTLTTDGRGKELPAGWSAAWSAEHGCYYYGNGQVSQWQFPE